MDGPRASPPASASPRQWLLVVAASLGVLALGFLDYVSGTEVRVFPLYFVPISAAAWWSGRRWALVMATASALAWSISNDLAGLRASLSVDVINFLMQLGSFVLVGVLIAGLRSAHARERERSRTDSLTSLLNTRGFFDEAPRLLALAHRHGEPLTVAYVDLDNFKRVNDTQGHARGDVLLRVAAETMREQLRAGDLAARMGGDEFVLLLPHTDLAGAHGVLERLHRALEQRLHETSPVTGASMGAAVFTSPPSDLDEIIRQADAVMYSVKSSGRGRVVIASADADAPREHSSHAAASSTALDVARDRRRQSSGRHAVAQVAEATAPDDDETPS